MLSIILWKTTSTIMKQHKNQVWYWERGSAYRKKPICVNNLRQTRISLIRSFWSDETNNSCAAGYEEMCRQGVYLKGIVGKITLYLMVLVLINNHLVELISFPAKCFFFLAVSFSPLFYCSIWHKLKRKHWHQTHTFKTLNYLSYSKWIMV